MNKRAPTEMPNLSERLGYAFKDKQLLEQALTHGSYTKASHSYERLEFLGDRVLGLVIADALFQKHSKEPEGKLSARLSALVRADVCTDVAESIGLQDFVRVGAVEKINGINKTRSVLADVMEAVIGAIYLDAGIDVARAFILRHWKAYLAKPDTMTKDAKTFVQEWLLSRGTALPEYRVISRSGPEHLPEFTVKLTLPGHGEAIGKGKSKQLAEMAAAQSFIEEGGLRK